MTAGLSATERPSGRSVATVLLASGAIGFMLGLVCYPSWHDGLDRAQILAGVVQYPPDSPLSIILTRSWTVVHQFLALLLHWGMTERTLALMVSGVAGMVSLQALSMVILALSGDPWLAILAPVGIDAAKAAVGSVTYPVFLMGGGGTDGIIGFSYFVLSLSLIGVGQARAGAVLLGFAPAVYPIMGFWGWGIAAVGSLASPGTLTPVRRHFLLGAAAAAVCLMAHHQLQGSARGIGATWGAFTQPSPLVAQAFTYWDVHRQPFSLLTGSGAAIGLSVGLALLWMSRFAHAVPLAARTLLLLIVVTVAAGGLLSLSYWLVPAPAASMVALLMPSRLMEVGIFMYPALVLGLLGRYRADPRSLLTLAVALVALLIIGLSTSLYDTTVIATRLSKVVVGLAGLTLVLLAERHRRGLAPPRVPAVAMTWLRRAPILALVAGAFFEVGWAALDFDARLRRELQDRTTDPLLAEASRRPGVLLTSANLSLIQLRARRPVLLDGMTLDRTIYAPDALPGIARILERVYGVDFADPPEPHSGALVPETGRALWESRTPADWQSLAKEFDLSDVITYPEWRLQLPLVAASPAFRLYALPRE